MKRPAPLAKLSRPRLHRPVPRERLFAQLDAARRERAAICVTGPPGAGKTTLVASWLEAREVPGIWYQIDGGDADLATFFFYLAEAARPFSRRGQRPLPRLTPEYLGDVPGFARRFFRALFARLPDSAVLTLDNYQQVAAEEALHQLVAAAVEEVPPGVCLAVISRRDPPECYARLLANAAVATIDWDSLRLDRAEAEAIAAQHAPIAPLALGRLHEQTDGWAAGLVLALQGAAALPDPGQLDHLTHDATFDYFAAEIFARVPAEMQRLLMCTAFLPDIPVSLAERLTGDPRAGARLEDLYRRHLFTHRKSGPEPVYWYHALFQRFLRAQAAQRLGDAASAQVRARAAVLLEDRDFEAALSLYAGLQAWDAAERLITREAATLIAQGRGKVVSEHVGQLPPGRVAGSPWLSCWLGLAMAGTAPVEARTHLERSYALATAAGDAPCRVRAAAGVMQTYLLEYNAFRPLDHWAAVLSEALAEARNVPPDVEVQARSALVAAFSFRAPAHPDAEPNALRVFELLPQVPDVNQRLSAVVSVLAWGSLAGPMDMARRALPVAESLWRQVDVTPMNVAVSGYLISWYYCLVEDRAQCLKVLETLEDLYHHEGLRAAGGYAATIGVWLELYDCDLPAAQAWLEKLIASADPARAFDRGMIDGARGWLYLLQSRPEAALPCNNRAVQAFETLGSVRHECGFREQLVWNHIDLCNWSEASRHLVANRVLVESFDSPFLQFGVLAAEATIAMGQHDLQAAREHAAELFALARAHDDEVGLISTSIGKWMPPLCALALDAGIDTEYVRRLIRRFGWRPPAGHSEHWPWAIRIHALGTFRVLIDDQPLTFSRKAPRKPIALLQAIVAFGGADVAVTRLLDALWPDADGDSAYHSLSLGLHRLRRLLGHPEAILMAEGRLSLNPGLVWCDAHHLQQLLEPGQRSTQRVGRALQLYRGHLLADSDEHAWAIGPRETLREKLVRAVSEVAAELESVGSHEQAASWYAGGTNIDPLAEAFSQGLLRCYSALGRPDDAKAALERLDRLCRARLGSRPSARTLALARRLGVGPDA